MSRRSIRYRIVFLTLTAILAAPIASQARLITITLQPVDDGDVRSNAPNAVFNGNTLRITNNMVGNEAAKGYFRYELPSDFGTAVSARFTATRTLAGAWNSTYSVYGLPPGSEGTIWADNALTWNNAPANAPGHPYNFDASAPLLGSFTVAGANHGGKSLDSYGFGSSALTDYVNGNNGGSVTLMASRAGVSTSYDLFSASENDDYYGATLTLTYETNPLAEADGAAKAREHWHAWRQAQTAFPSAAWSYWVRYSGAASEYQIYADAGMNMVQIPIEHYAGARAAGLNTLIGSWQNLHLDPQKLADYIAFPGTDHGGVTGYLLFDEPEPNRFADLAAAVDTIYDSDARGAIPMITVLPNWAWERSSHRVNTWGSYRNYVEGFADVVKPAVLYATTYPTLLDGTDRHDYYANLEIIRRVSLDRGIGMMGFVIVTGHTLYRQPSESDLRWQVYSNLAYGAKGIWWYNYRIEPINGFQEGMVYHDSGLPTPVYERVQEINAELQGFGKKLLSLHSVGVYHTGPVIPEDALRYWATGEPGNFSALNRVVGDDFLIGEFINIDDYADDSSYLMLVNKRHGAGLASNDTLVANQIAFTVDSAYQYVYLHPPSGEPPQLLTLLGEVQMNGETLTNAYQIDFTGGQGFLLQLSQSPLLDGDFNGDGLVDGADFLAWQRGHSPSPLSPQDLIDWKAGFGIASGTTNSTTVPEPTGAIMIVGGAATLGAQRLRLLRILRF